MREAVLKSTRPAVSERTPDVATFLTASADRFENGTLVKRAHESRGDQRAA